MTAVDRVISDYKSTLSTLEKNDKLRINVLTILAEDYAQHSQQIANLIEESIFNAETIPLKLVRLYLIDSIVKNVTSSGSYADKFSDNLVKVFLHVFQRGDEKVRASLFKLRNTWQGVFPRGKLYTLDVEVHGIDPKWPSVFTSKPPTTQPQVPAVIQNVKPQQTKVQPQPAIVKVPPQKVQSIKEKVQPIKEKVQPTNVKVQPEKVQLPRIPKIQSATKNQPPVTTQETKTKITTPPPIRPPTTTQLSHISIPVTTQPPQVTTQSQSFITTPVTTQSRTFSPPQVNTQQVTPVTSVFPLQATTLINPSIFSQAPTAINSTEFRPQAPTMNHPPPINLSIPPPRHFLPPPQIRNDTPRLPNLPSNNRIFVDGKAYEVFYLDNIAVIERNGVPHRISFCGPPRDVIIDGVAYRMAFGEVKPVMIDGQTHYLRFGAPSRELYMGEFPFKGAFGGPPIAATINGRRHEIRLCGPPPEVKIEQDPCYELIRQLQNLRQNNGSNLPQPKKDEKEVNLGDLLNKIQKSGVLNSLNTALKATERSTPPIVSPAFPSSRKREATPPIVPSNIKMGKFEVCESPATSLSQFYMPALKMRYLGIIKSIHRRGSTCPDCGIFFKDTNLPNYRNHLDEHIQNDIDASRTTIHPMGASRQRYLSEEEWVVHSKVEELNRPKPTIKDEEDTEDEEDSDMEE